MFGSSDEISWKTSVTGMYGLTHVNHLSICSACVRVLASCFCPIVQHFTLDCGSTILAGVPRIQKWFSSSIDLPPATTDSAHIYNAVPYHAALRHGIRQVRSRGYFYMACLLVRRFGKS
jgi:hypothetical protein